VLGGGNAIYGIVPAGNATGIAGQFTNSEPTNTTVNTVNVVSNGAGNIPDHSVGNASNFFLNNTTSVGAGVRGEVNTIFGNGGAAGIYGVSSGTGGYGGYFVHTNATGFGMTLYAENMGQGSTVVVQTDQGGDGVRSTVLGAGSAINGIVPAGATGVAGQFSNAEATNNTVNTVNVVTNGNGHIPNNGVGNAGNFFVNNTGSVASGVRGEVNTIFGNIGAAGIYGTASGTGGYGGYFEHSSATGFGEALRVVTNGAGWTANFISANNSGKGITTSTPANQGDNSFNVGNGTISYSTQNPYTTGSIVDDAHLVVTAIGNVNIPVGANDGVHIFVINNSGGVVTVTNTTVGNFNINNGRACEFIFITGVSAANWIPVQP
jgi:hypothetical protein